MLPLESAEFVNTDRMTVGCREICQAEESFASLETSLNIVMDVVGSISDAEKAETSCRP